MAHEALWETLTGVIEARDFGEAAVAEAAQAPRHALSPWALWLLVAVARHLRRQERVGEIVKAQLGVDLDEVARSGRAAILGHVSPQGRIADRGTYSFHERGIRWKHDHTYETVEIDLVEGDTGHFDFRLLAELIHEGANLRYGETRLYALHPSCETFEYAFDELVELGLLAVRPGPSRLARLSAEAEPHRALLIDVCYAYHIGEPHQLDLLGMAARLGDWMEADRVARWSRERGAWARVFTRPRAAEQQARRRARVLARSAADRSGTEIIALAEIDEMAAAPHVREALAGPHDLRCVAAMRALRLRPNGGNLPTPDYSADVLALFRRIDRDGREHERVLWPLCARFLLARGLYVDEVVATFSSLRGMLAAPASILAFEHAPGLAVPLVRRALHAPEPIARADAVAILVLLDEPWCATTLAEALTTSVAPDPLETLEWRTGLWMLKDPTGAARAWEAAHPLTEEDMASGQRCEVWVRQRMRDLRDALAPIRVQRAKARLLA